MNILYLCHRIPYPPNKGDKIRSFHQIRHLAKSHTVHLACLVDDREDLRYVDELRKYCATIDAVLMDGTTTKLKALAALLSGKPLSVAAFYSAELQTRINTLLADKKIDVIFAFSSAMAEYARNVNSIPRVMDFVDVDSDKWQLYSELHSMPMSWVYRLEAKRLGAFEEEVARTFDHSIFVSAKEAEIFRERVPNRPISVVSNGVDLEYFTPSPSEYPQTDPPSLVFTGAMDYFPNADAVRWFCAEILPLVQREAPEVQFFIVGRSPTPEVKALAAQRGVTVTGNVPDVRPYLQQAQVAVAPFRIARGVQNKVLEAMSMSRPVVGTALAFQGTVATKDDGIRSADDPAAFAREVLNLLADAGLRDRCGTQARRFVETHHRWEDQGGLLEKIIRDCIAVNPAPPPSP